MDAREARNLRAEFWNRRYEQQQLRERQNQGGGSDGGGCAGCGGCLLVVVGVLIAIFVIGSIVVGRAGSGSAAPNSSSQESIQLGPYTQVFDSPLPADPAQAKVIEGFRQGFTLWMKSDIEMSLVPPVTSYVTGHARSHLLHSVATAKARNRVPAGTDRFFGTRVTAITDTSATVTTCEDLSKAREENPRTGEIDPAYTLKAGQDYAFETWQMVLRSGNWAISDFSTALAPDPAAATCLPNPV